MHPCQGAATVVPRCRAASWLGTQAQVGSAAAGRRGPRAGPLPAGGSPPRTRKGQVLIDLLVLKVARQLVLVVFHVLQPTWRGGGRARRWARRQGSAPHRPGGRQQAPGAAGWLAAGPPCPMHARRLQVQHAVQRPAASQRTSNRDACLSSGASTSSASYTSFWTSLEPPCFLPGCRFGCCCRLGFAMPAGAPGRRPSGL